MIQNQQTRRRDGCRMLQPTAKGSLRSLGGLHSMSSKHGSSQEESKMASSRILKEFSKFKRIEESIEVSSSSEPSARTTLLKEDESDIINELRAKNMATQNQMKEQCRIMQQMIEVQRNMQL